MQKGNLDLRRVANLKKKIRKKNSYYSLKDYKTPS